MLTLALDTASPAPALALAQGAAVWHAPLPPARLAEMLPSAVKTLLAKAGKSPGEIALLAAASGPGAFMALRAGLAAARALALALRLPLRALSRAHILAFACAEEDASAHRVMICLAAPRGRLFARPFLGAHPLAEGQLLEPAGLEPCLRAHKIRHVFADAGILLPPALKRLQPQIAPALALARLAAALHRQGAPSAPPLPFYLPQPESSLTGVLPAQKQGGRAAPNFP